MAATGYLTLSSFMEPRNASKRDSPLTSLPAPATCPSKCSSHRVKIPMTGYRTLAGVLF